MIKIRSFEIKKYSIKTLIIILLKIFLLSFLSFISLAAEDIVIKETSLGNTTILSIKLPNPVIEIISTSQGKASSIKIPGLSKTSINGQPTLPCFHKLLNGKKEQFSYRYEIIAKEIIQLEENVQIFMDRPKDEPDKIIEWRNEENNYSEQILNVSDVGMIKNLPVSALYFYPVKMINNRQIEYISKVKIYIEKSKISGVITVTESKNKFAKALGFEKKQDILFHPLKKLSTYDDENTEQIKILLDTTGIFRIYRSDLSKKYSNIKNQDPRNFSIRNRGKEIPIFVKGENDGSFDNTDFIEFLGERNPNSVADYEFDPFTDNNVYWLSWEEGRGLRFAEESVLPNLPTNKVIQPVDYDYVAHIEKNQKFETMGYIHTNHLTHEHDQWFFYNMVVAGTSQEFTFNLNWPNTSTSKLINYRVALQSITLTSNNQARIYINGNDVGEGSWSWQQTGIISEQAGLIPENNILKHGENNLTILSEINPDDPYATFALDWIEIKYFKKFIAKNDYIEFHRPTGQVNGDYQFRIKGFQSQDISIYKKGLSKIRDFEIFFDESDETFTIKMQDYINSEVEYIAAAGESILSPDSIEIVTLNNVLSETDGCEHLCIVADPFWETSQELEDFYNNQGVECLRVKCSDIYNQFNHGIKSPYAIKQFLVQMSQVWSETPKYVLLIGDANIKNRDLDFLPTVCFQTYKYGAAPTDHWFTTLNENDIVPDFAIGRFPCGTVEELETMIRKRIAYDEEQVIDSWRDHYLFIAGYEDSFKDQTDYLIKNRVNPPCTIDRLLVNPSSLATEYFGGTDSLINKFNRGLALINYMGHGGGAVWADKSLFTLDDISLLNNKDKLPFCSSLTCFTADFAARSSLGESLIEYEDGGAIGLWGASGIGWIINDFLLGQTLFDFIDKPELTVGEAILCTKTWYIAENPFFGYLKPSMVYQYNLLGDPAVNLNKPQSQAELTLANYEFESGETFNVDVSLPFNNGSYQAQLYNDQKYPVSSGLITGNINSSNLDFEITIPDTFASALAYVNFYAVNEDHSEDCNGVVYLSVDGSDISHFEFLPQMPAEKENIDILVSFTADVESVICSIDTGAVYLSMNSFGQQQVSAFNNQETVFQIPLTSANQKDYKLSETFQITQANKRFACQILWQKNGENETSRIYFTKTKERPDLDLEKVKPVGITKPEYEVFVNNISQDTIQSVLKVYKVESNDSLLLSSRISTLMPNQITKITLPAIIDTGLINLLFKVEPVDDIIETSIFNNTLKFDYRINSFLVTKELGSTINGFSNDTIKYDEHFAFYFPPGAVNDSVAIFCDPQEEVQNSQPDFGLVPFMNNNIIGYELSTNKSIELIHNPIIVMNLQSDLEKLQIVSRKPAFLIWVRQNTEQAGIQYKTEIDELSVFCLAKIEDQVEPDIEINFNGQRFFEEGYVSKNPTISLIFEDENGIHLAKQSCQIKIDDNVVDFNELVYADSSVNSSIVNCSFTPVMEDGLHQIEINIEDAAGNIGTRICNFNVTDKYKIYDYGNYPNPFRTRTWFVFELTRPVDSFEIMIYNASGRKIVTLNDFNVTTDINMNEAGYHEVSWNGKDKNGELVGNGVYFYQLKAKIDSKVFTTRGVIAKER